MVVAVDRSAYGAIRPVGCGAEFGRRVGRFGPSVAISGDFAAVGAYRDGEAGGPSQTGAVYVFHRDEGTWGEPVRLTVPGAAAQDYLGKSVAIDGLTLMAGAPGADGPDGGGSAYAFTYDEASGQWGAGIELRSDDVAAGDGFGSSVAVHGSWAVFGAPGDESFTGAAYVFERVDSSWTQRKKITAGNDAEQGASFGTSVDIWGTHAIVGAHGEDGDGTDHGAAYVFDSDKNGQSH